MPPDVGNACPLCNGCRTITNRRSSWPTVVARAARNCLTVPAATPLDPRRLKLDEYGAISMWVVPGRRRHPRRGAR